MIALFFLLSIAHASPISTKIGDSEISIELGNFDRATTSQEIVKFIERSAAPVADFYGKFPVKKLSIEVVPNTRNSRGLFGREFHGKKITFYLGSKATAHSLENDGILTHEMFHLGFPDLGNETVWLEEGLATYLAHIARARSGQISQADLWKEVREGFEDAQPKKDSPGLDEETRYRRIYWGGAMFWMMIDIEAREKNLSSVQAIVTSILNSGATNASHWKISKLQRVVDKTAGFSLFEKWHKKLAKSPFTLDLQKLWEELGIRFEKEQVHFDDQAPKAKIRKAISAP